MLVLQVELDGRVRLRLPGGQSIDVVYVRGRGRVRLGFVAPPSVRIERVPIGGAAEPDPGSPGKEAPCPPAS